MDRIVDIKLGQELSPERWNQAADNLEIVFPYIAERLRKINTDNQGKQDEADFMADAMLALMALRYVAKFAFDKCRFIPL